MALVWFQAEGIVKLTASAWMQLVLQRRALDVVPVLWEDWEVALVLFQVMLLLLELRVL